MAGSNIPNTPTLATLATQTLATPAQPCYPVLPSERQRQVTQMKAGMVTTVRINPHDCQCVLAVLREMGVNPYDGRSWAACVSLALSGMIGTMLKAGIIEEPDGFAFSTNMAPFLGSRNNKTKHAHADALYRKAAHVLEGASIPGLGEVTKQQAIEQYGPERSAAQPLLMDPVTRQMLVDEMIALDDKVNEGGKWTAEEAERYRYLNEKLFT